MIFLFLINKAFYKAFYLPHIEDQRESTLCNSKREIKRKIDKYRNYEKI